MPSVTEHGLQFTHFDASEVPAAERFERWQHRLSESFQLTLADGVARSGLVAETWVWALGGLMLSPRTCGSHTLSRSARTVRTSHLDHYKLHLRVGGNGITRLDAAGTRVSVGAGEFVLSDMSRPEQMSADQGSSIAMFIPRDALDALLPQPLDLHGVVPRGICSVLLANHLQSLSGLMPSMTLEEVPGARLSTLHLLAASLAPSARTLAVARPAVEGTLRRQICAFIDSHVVEADLSPERLCAHFKVSRSTLYRLFEPLGGVANHVKERRLLRIHALLASPKPRRYLAHVAEDHGFKSPTHFSRAFRAQFGYSPSDVPVRGAERTSASKGLVRTGSAFENWLQSLRT